jgi:hypothetical protein
MTEPSIVEFWDCGHELFKTTSETFPAGFVAGDAFGPALIQPREPFDSVPTTPRPVDLGTLKSLTPLQGHVSAIHASAFFHLFTEEEQVTLAKQVASLLSPEPGSVIFGVHAGLPEKGLNTQSISVRRGPMFCHSPESWGKLWEKQVFKPGFVKVHTKLVQRERGEADSPFLISNWLVWSVTRL